MFCKTTGCYFTALPISQMDGDGWNDSPASNNAEVPHVDNQHDLFVVAIDGDFDDLSRLHSADFINQGNAPWIKSYNTAEIFHAGITYR